MDDLEKYEEEKTKGKMFAITTISVIIAIIVFITLGIFSIKAFFKDLSTHKYYVLEVNELNKQEVITMLENEDKKYCESLYKIEYTTLFPNGINAKIYCNDEEDIYIPIEDDKPSEIINYISRNGNLEKR